MCIMQSVALLLLSCGPNRRKTARIFFSILILLSSSLIPMVNSECVTSDDVKTNLQGDTGSFGNMFDLVAIGDSDVRVTGIDFYTDVKTNITFHLWTKQGTYKGHETSERSWFKIAHGWTYGNGVGVTTPIPSDFFIPFIIKAGDTHGFVLAMEEADLRYDMGSTEGSTLKETEHLRLTQGNGVAQFPPFPPTGTFYAPRVFNGRISYDAMTCGDEAASRPVVPGSPVAPGSPVLPESPVLPVSPVVSPVVELTYLFAIQTRDDFQTAFRDTENVVRNVLDNSMTDINGYGLKNHKDLMDIANMSLEDVTTTESTGVKSDIFTGTCDGCLMIDINVKVKHSTSENISPEEIRYFLLLHADMIEQAMKFEYGEYRGPRPADTQETISLEGVSLDVFNDKELVEYFERTTKMFLNQQVSVADFARVKITSRTSQDGYTGRDEMSAYNSEVQYNDNNRRRILRDVGPMGKYDESGGRSREHMFSSVDLGITITGEYQPPPDIDFREETQESFERDGGVLVQMLQKDDPTGDFRDLSSITSMESEHEVAIDPRLEDVALDDYYGDLETAGAEGGFWNKPGVISVYVIAAILVGGVVFAMWIRAVRKSDSNSDADSKDFSFGGSIYSVLREKAQTIEKLWGGQGSAPPNNVVVGQSGRAGRHHSMFAQPINEPVASRERQRHSSYVPQTHPINSGSFGNASEESYNAAPNVAPSGRSVYSQAGSMNGSNHRRQHSMSDGLNGSSHNGSSHRRMALPIN